MNVREIPVECARDSCRMCERFLSNVREIPVECARRSDNLSQWTMGNGYEKESSDQKI